MAAVLYTTRVPPQLRHSYVSVWAGLLASQGNTSPRSSVAAARDVEAQTFEAARSRAVQTLAPPLLAPLAPATPAAMAAAHAAEYARLASGLTLALAHNAAALVSRYPDLGVLPHLTADALADGSAAAQWQVAYDAQRATTAASAKAAADSHAGGGSSSSGGGGGGGGGAADAGSSQALAAPAPLVRCRVCKSDKVATRSMQLRSADEGMDTLCVCETCGARELKRN